MPYVKLDAGILDSTLWVEDAVTCKVFITMLAMCDSEGLCPATAPGIARRANVSMDDARRALQILESPDAESRTLDDEGRRIRRIDGGYQVVNYTKYRNKDHTNAERQRRYRASKENKNIDESNGVTSLPVTTSSAYASTSVVVVNKNNVIPSGVDPSAWSDWDAYRQTKKKSEWTKRAQQIASSFLTKYPPEVQRQIVETSIQSGWTGLFEPKGQSRQPSQPTGALHRAAEAIRKAREERNALGSD